MKDADLMENLITRELAGEASELERRRLRQWRLESPENERLYQESARAWELAAPQEVADRMSVPPPVERIIAEAERHELRVNPFQRRPTVRVRTWSWAAAAAAAALAVGVGMVWLRRGPVEQHATGSFETSTVLLADGSVVRLGPESRLQVWSVDERTVSLDGTAFFAVAPDSNTPFAVHTDLGHAEVLGTRFEIRADADSLRLVVVEGRVGLSATGERVEVVKGNVSRVLAGSAPSAPRTVDVWELLDWPDGLLIFQATPLEQVAEEIGARFNVSFAIRDSILAGRTVTAWFGDDPLEDVATTVCQVVGARCVIGDTIEVVQ